MRFALNTGPLPLRELSASVRGVSLGQCRRHVLADPRIPLGRRSPDRGLGKRRLLPRAHGSHRPSDLRHEHERHCRLGRHIAAVRRRGNLCGFFLFGCSQFAKATDKNQLCARSAGSRIRMYICPSCSTKFSSPARLSSVGRPSRATRSASAISGKRPALAEASSNWFW
ncbi:hypothetical protein OCA8868_01707 [Octadecabacter ascidiaceicola]|uniref:Uncharacterized protein n=1 Tax=Octadecabacter ascidiaceicola TaxID=1655543 RepID=A0A238K5U7_9RHOB|nr:hypothetical protein OCA8868_01707 [Octadecabacter ascidiaceicola]